MKWAVDTNILFDLLANNPASSGVARQALGDALQSGPVVICPIVYAELAAGFDSRVDLERFLNDLGISIEEFTPAALWRAGEAWRAYTRRRGRAVQCSHCGRQAGLACPACQAPIVWRQHLISDFLIGAHASAQSDVLLTRDPGYYRTYFPDLRIEVPA